MYLEAIKLLLLFRKQALGGSLYFTANIYILKVHKIEIFFGSDFEFCTISLLVMF